MGDANGKPIMIYKQPKALSWKKSQKGCCRVALDGQSYEDELRLCLLKRSERIGLLV